jgi:hypothetical protein
VRQLLLSQSTPYLQVPSADKSPSTLSPPSFNLSPIRNTSHIEDTEDSVSHDGATVLETEQPEVLSDSLNDDTPASSTAASTLKRDALDMSPESMRPKRVRMN